MSSSNATPFRGGTLRTKDELESAETSDAADPSEVGIRESDQADFAAPSVPAQLTGLNAESDAPDLDRLQRWMFNVVVHPGGVREALRTDRAQDYYKVDEFRLEDIVLPSEGLTAADRMQIYSNCYTWRLTEVLEEEFPSIRKYLGEDAFYHLAKDYLDLHPSQHYNLQFLGKDFARFIRESSELEHRAFLADVATVERSMEDVFSEKQAESVSPEEFLAVSAEAWSGIVFRLIPALEIHSLRYPVHEFMTAVRNDDELSVPEARESYVLVYRKDYRSWRTSISREQFRILKALQEGLSLGGALERCANSESFDFAAFEKVLPSTFQEWTAEGIFSEVVDTSEE